MSSVHVIRRKNGSLVSIVYVNITFVATFESPWKRKMSLSKRIILHQKKRINLDPYNEVQIIDLRVLSDEFNPV